MYLNGIQIPICEIANTFASFFDEQVSKIVNEMIIEPDVYIGKHKLNAQNHNFTSEVDVLLAVKSLFQKKFRDMMVYPKNIN